MQNCDKIRINYDLYEKLTNIADPCNTTLWLESLELESEEPQHKIYKAKLAANVPKSREYYTLKESPLNATSIKERKILETISADMLQGAAPILFPFMYMHYVCVNTDYMLMQPYEISLAAAIQQNYGTADTIEWWAQVLYQLAKAVYYLEDNEINHNYLNYVTCVFQNVDKNYNNVAMMITDFETAGVKQSFVLGRDLNYFLYMLFYDGVPKGYFPKKLADELHQFIYYKNIQPQHNEGAYMHGIRRTYITEPNWKSSGKHISRWLATYYPHVTDRCNAARLNKLYGIGIGAIVGDAFGMPVEFDNNHPIIKNMYPSAQFNGLLKFANLPAGTFTDDSQMSLALIDAIMDEDRKLVPSAVARRFKDWAVSKPLDIGHHTALVLKNMNRNGNNWQKASSDAYNKEPNNAANGAVMRVWPIAVLHHYDDISEVITDTFKQSIITHMNNDAVYAAVFVGCLIRKLLDSVPLDTAINECIDIVKDHVSELLFDALSHGHSQNMSTLNGGTGWVVDTMNTVMWAIRNTTSFADAIITAANVNGDSDTNASITGAIAGALYGFNAIPGAWIKILNNPNPHNKWHGNQMTIEHLKDKIATLAQC